MLKSITEALPLCTHTTEVPKLSSPLWQHIHLCSQAMSGTEQLGIMILSEPLWALQNRYLSHPQGPNPSEFPKEHHWSGSGTKQINTTFFPSCLNTSLYGKWASAPSLTWRDKSTYVSAPRNWLPSKRQGILGSGVPLHLSFPAKHFGNLEITEIFWEKTR